MARHRRAQPSSVLRRETFLLFTFAAMMLLTQRFALCLHFLLFLYLATSGTVAYVSPSSLKGSGVPQGVPSSAPFVFKSIQPRKSVAQLQMCICVDCARVTNCEAYHFVESKHGQPHMTETPDFTPRDGSPTIHVNVRTVRTKDGRAEADRLWREHEGETAKAEAQSSDDDAEQLHGETVYDLTPVTTYEYDVVACEDFVEDKGCWVRNMPEEIRKANPNFVPT